MPYTLDTSCASKSLSSIFKQQDIGGSGEDCGFLSGDNMPHLPLEKLRGPMVQQATKNLSYQIGSDISHLISFQ
jgi:hypothetical protein